jgi:hypothetical protein
MNFNSHFPLTPTLSRGERESSVPRVVLSDELDRSPQRTSVLPLPWGRAGVKEEGKLVQSKSLGD